ncbi:MAG: SM-20-related protein [Acidobacteriota bacterium]|nr:SM-20-related protein [Acidobacteriota bacterium]MDT7807621.1 SM-20-related protein [Acidobacteriota bacterium]
MSTKATTLLGIYTEEDFLDRATCELVKAEMRASEHTRAKIYDRDWNNVVDDVYRSTLQVKVGERINTLVRERLLERRPIFNERFGVEVTDCQGPTYLIYKPGDFFEPHKDESQKSDAPVFIKTRQVSAVIFLSDEDSGAEAGEYAGGSLAFYGLLKDPRCAQIGIPVKGKGGLLVAFRSDVYHQVSPVTRGERFTIVSWFI